MWGTIRAVSNFSEIHNQNSGAVGRDSIQVGIVHGDVMLRGQVPTDESLAGDLAAVVGERSRREEEHWRVGDPDPLRVYWHTAEKDLLDSWENIHRCPGRHDPVPLSGQFAAIRETFQATGSQRLVILGRAGAGKTVLGRRLILDLLDRRGHRDPVPVLFSLNDWNPATTGLRDWMIYRLIRDHPFLEQRDATGRLGAAVLVDRDWILPVLDGFDEIPDQHHHAAINQISQVQLPLVLTSRPDQYASAAQTAKAVGRAGAIEIEDLTLNQARRYLCQSTSPVRASEWETVFEQLHTASEDPASRNLVPVLTTPLMVMLARAIYNDTGKHSPVELLDTTRFPGRTNLEQHLLGGYVDTVYSRPRATTLPGATRPAWNPDQARRWLGFLANGLRHRNTHDFTWWQLASLLPRRTRILATFTTHGLAFGLTYVFGLALTAATHGTNSGITPWLTNALVVGLAIWLTFGLPAGFLNELRFARRQAGRRPEWLRLHWPRPRRLQRRSKRAILTSAASELTSGFLIGLTTSLAIRLAFSLMAIADHFTGKNTVKSVGVNDFAQGFTEGIVIGLVFGAVNIMVAVLGESPDPHGSAQWQLLTNDRTITLIRTVPTAALVFSITVWMAQIPYTTGFWLGSLAALIRVALSAWGSWLLFARLWLPLTGHLPWRSQRFLNDAYDRGILRQEGASYQFRHVQLRDHLANTA